MEFTTVSYLHCYLVSSCGASKSPSFEDCEDCDEIDCHKIEVKYAIFWENLKKAVYENKGKNRRRKNGL